MREFQYKKLVVPDLQVTKIVYIIEAKHGNALHVETIAELYDGQIAEAVTDFLNQREKDFEQARIHRLMHR